MHVSRRPRGFRNLNKKQEQCDLIKFVEHYAAS